MKFYANEFCVNPTFGTMKIKKVKEDKMLHLLGETDILHNHAIVHENEYAFEIACNCLRRHLNGELDMEKYGMMEVLGWDTYRVVILYHIEKLAAVNSEYFEEE